MASGVFLSFFFQTHFANIQFVTICDMPSVFLEFEALHLIKFWFERSSFLKTCTARLQLTMFQISDVRNIFAEKSLAKIN